MSNLYDTHKIFFNSVPKKVTQFIEVGIIWLIPLIAKTPRQAWQGTGFQPVRNPRQKTTL